MVSFDYSLIAEPARTQDSATDFLDLAAGRGLERKKALHIIGVRTTPEP